jgi:hypothetical protein
MYLLNTGNTIAYLYKWSQKSTGKYYVGSRTAKNCHPMDGYICSSRVVKPLILENPADWEREVLVIGSSDYIRELESSYLRQINAKTDPLSYNMHNGDGKFTTAGIPSWNKGLTVDDPRIAAVAERTRNRPSPLRGRKLGPYSDSRRKNISESLKGNIPWNTGVNTGPLSNEHKDKISNTLRGVPKTEEHRNNLCKPKSDQMRKKLSATKTGKSWPKVVCRISDKREMDIGNFTKWLNHQTPNT